MMEFSKTLVLTLMHPTRFPCGIVLGVKDSANNFAEMDSNLKLIETSNRSHHPGVKKCEIYS